LGTGVESTLMDRDQERAIEWDCEKAVRQYYHHVDLREFDEAAALFTSDVLWEVLGVRLTGRDTLLKGLHGALADGTIRHIVTNTLVNVVDENTADVRFYLSIYYTQGVKVEDNDGPLPFDGPHRIMDQGDTMIRTEQGWRTSYRWGKPIFRRDIDQPIQLETWAGKAPTDAQ
jgi:hypothetical protein